MPPPPATTAILLAAGCGTRLRGVQQGPKGLLEIGGETLVGRSIRWLRRAGVCEVVLVTGWRAEDYTAALREWGEGVRCVHNPDFSTTGSLQSLVRGAATVDGAAWVLESDLIYEPRALAVLAEAGGDGILASGPTRSGDEVWVRADAHGRLRELTKAAPDGWAPVGELVGICHCTATLLQELSDAAAALSPESHYEDGLNRVATRRGIPVRVEPDLVWGEIDHAEHLARVRREVWPRLEAAERVAT